MNNQFKLEIGEAVIAKVERKLILRDRYSYEEFMVSSDEDVELEPAPPIHVPKKIASHLMLSFEKPIVVRGASEFWVEAPYEVAVKIGGKILKYLSPVKVKHALYGDIVDGIICRFFKSGVSESPTEREEVAKCKVIVEGGGVGTIKRLVLPVENLMLYKVGRKVYYEVVKVEVEPEIARVTLTREPPVDIGEVENRERKGLIKKPTFEMGWL